MGELTMAKEDKIGMIPETVCIPIIISGMKLNMLLMAITTGLGWVSNRLFHVQAIEREDGSGHNWNVLGCFDNGERKSLFIKTV